MSDLIELIEEDILHANLFTSQQEACDVTWEWIEEYNVIRHHEALEGLPPYK